MKAHIGVDDESGLVHTLKTSTAKVNDNAAAPDRMQNERRGRREFSGEF
ncbi:MAG: transposase [Candidatus Gracilibacteria bacterium]